MLKTFNSNNKTKTQLRLSSERGAGFIFLEVVIAIALISIVFITLLGMGFSSLNISASLQQQNQADALAKEEIEAVRAFRDATATTWDTTGIGSYSTGVAYHALASGNPSSWSLVAGSETIDSFTRQAVFDRVNRDAAGNIVSSGTDDPDTRKVTVQVAFGSKTHQLVTYLTNWQK